MGKGAKIAIGCFVVALLGAIGVSAVLLGGFWWAKGKVQDYTGNIAKGAEEFAKYEKQANANPFTPPADGAFTEDRLLKFLEVRKAVYSVYEAHRVDFESMKAKKQAELGDAMKIPGILADIKMAQAKAQAQVGMSDGEYVFMVTSVYGAAMNATAQKETGKTASQTFDEALDQSKKAMEEAAKQAGASGMPEAQAQVDQAKQAMSALGAPQSNIDLYRKHEADIKKYTMEGLALIGL